MVEMVEMVDMAAEEEGDHLDARPERWGLKTGMAACDRRYDTYVNGHLFGLVSSR